MLENEGKEMLAGRMSIDSSPAAITSTTTADGDGGNKEVVVYVNHIPEQQNSHTSTAAASSILASSSDQRRNRGAAGDCCDNKFVRSTATAEGLSIIGKILPVPGDSSSSSGLAGDCDGDEISTTQSIISSGDGQQVAPPRGNHNRFGPILPAGVGSVVGGIVGSCDGGSTSRCNPSLASMHGKVRSRSVECERKFCHQTGQARAEKQYSFSCHSYQENDDHDASHDIDDFNFTGVNSDCYRHSSPPSATTASSSEANFHACPSLDDTVSFYLGQNERATVLPTTNGDDQPPPSHQHANRIDLHLHLQKVATIASPPSDKICPVSSSGVTTISSNSSYTSSNKPNNNNRNTANGRSYHSFPSSLDVGSISSGGGLVLTAPSASAKNSQHPRPSSARAAIAGSSSRASPHLVRAASKDRVAIGQEVDI